MKWIDFFAPLVTNSDRLLQGNALNAVKMGTSELKAYKETFQLSRDTNLTRPQAPAGRRGSLGILQQAGSQGCCLPDAGANVVHASIAERLAAET